MENIKSQEISVFELLKVLWDDRKLFVKFLAVGVVISVIIVLISPKEWQTKTTMVVKSSVLAGQSRSLSRLAGIAGFNLGVGSTENINPYAYQDILKSDILIKELVNTTFYATTLKDSITLKDYFENHLKSGPKGYLTYIPSQLIKLISGKKSSDTAQPLLKDNGTDERFIIVSASDERLFMKVKESIFTRFDAEKGVYEIGFNTQDPMVAALVTQYLADYLIEYVSDFLSRDEKVKVDFITEQLAIKKANFEEKQNALASFRDSNFDLTSNRARSEEERLIANYNVAFGIYSSLEQSLEEAKIALAEQQSVLKAFGPIKVPVKAVGPRKLKIIIIFLFMAFASATGVSVFRLVKGKSLGEP